MHLCKDIAEFGVFAQALRAGALRGLPTRAAARPAPAPAPAPEPEAEGESTGRSRAMLPLLLAGGVGLLGAAVLIAAAIWFFVSQQ
jgi:hypothetical protein